MPTAHARRVGSSSAAPPPGPPDRSQLVSGVDEPTVARTGVVPGSGLDPVQPNYVASNGQHYYRMAVGEELSDVDFHCRVQMRPGASLRNFRVRGWPVANPTPQTQFAMLDLTLVGGSADNCYFESGDLTPAPENVGPANTGIRGGGGTGRFILFQDLPDGAMVYGGRLVLRQSLAQHPFSTWPASDPTRTNGDATHSDALVQVQGGHFEAHGCKASAIPYIDGVPYFDAAAPEWGGRYLPITNGAGWSCLLSSGDLTGQGDRPGDFVFEHGWLEGGKIPVYIVDAAESPTGRVSLAGTRIRRGLVGLPNATSPRYHVIKPGPAFQIDLTGTVACSDDRSSWTPSGSLVISNAG